MKEERMMKKISQKMMVFEEGNDKDCVGKNEFYPIEEEDDEDMPIKIKITHKSSKYEYDILTYEGRSCLEIIEEVNENEYMSEVETDVDSEIIKFYSPHENSSMENHNINGGRHFIIACVDDIPFTRTTYQSDDDLLFEDKKNLFKNDKNINDNGDSFFIGGIHSNSGTLLSIPLHETSEKQSLEERQISQNESGKKKGFLRSIFQSPFLNCFGLKSQLKSISPAITNHQNTIMDNESQCMRPV